MNNKMFRYLLPWPLKWVSLISIPMIVLIHFYNHQFIDIHIFKSMIIILGLFSIVSKERNENETISNNRIRALIFVFMFTWVNLAVDELMHYINVDSTKSLIKLFIQTLLLYHIFFFIVNYKERYK